VGEEAAAAAALARRALDARLPAAERGTSASLLALYLERDLTRPGVLEQGDVEFENRTWRTGGALDRDPPGEYRTHLRSAVARLSTMDRDTGVQVTEHYMRTRSLGWRARWDTVVALARGGAEPTAWRAAAIMASDPQEDPRRRVSLLIDFEMRSPDRGDDVTAMLRAWVHDARQNRRLRRAALDELLPRSGPGGELALARDAGLPVYLRSVAAFAHGKDQRRRQDAYEMLTALARAPGSSPRERLGCLTRRGLLTLLPWLERLDPTG
jgi:hypothetical protein